MEPQPLADNSLSILIKKEGHIVFHRFVVLPDEDVTLELFDNLLKKAVDEVRIFVDAREI